MKNKIFKTSIILVMILTMTMTNFVFVGTSLISYATDNMTTNHKNVDFEAYFKEEEKDALFLRVNVKKEGYFNGEIVLGDSNFTFKEAESRYVSKIEGNKLYLNQINAGTTEEIKVKIEPRKEEHFLVGILNMVSKITINGIYRDSTQKDIKIDATRDLNFKISEDNTIDNVQNEMKTITNKIMEIDGQEKRVVQISYHMGLKENNYPIQEIIAKIAVPEIEGKKAKIEKIETLNNMTVIDEQYQEGSVVLTLRNEANNEGKANWKKQGDENVVLTYLYDKEVETKDLEIKANEKIILYNGKELEVENAVTVGEEEKNGTIEVNGINAEDVIYKGKLKAGLERQYQTTTSLKVNLAKAIKEIEIEENNDQEGITVTYAKTIIKKEQFDKIFGQNGRMTIYNQDGEVLETITNTTANDGGNIVIDYREKEVSNIKVEATAPVIEGVLELNHSKIVRANGEAQEIKSNIMANETIAETTIKLENATTRASLEVDKESLSTVVGNNVEIKAVLISNSETYDLYENPELIIELPEGVEAVNIDKIDLLYEEELKIKDYSVEGRIIRVFLEGKQTQYKVEAIQGATIVMNTTITVDNRATTQDSEIKMTYKNGQEEGMESKAIKIVAPTDVTTIYSVPDLGVETIGQEEKTEVRMQKAEGEKDLEAQIEMINNNQETIENVKILGDFPTNHKENNLGIEILDGITLENAKIYYTENAEATDEIEKEENGWSETISDDKKVSKYLIMLDQLEGQSSVQGAYRYKVPANLDYNQVAKTGYEVKYTNRDTKVENELTSTAIEMTTGIGPKVETKLKATIGGKDFKEKVKNGEVIRYQIEVVNVGTEDIQDIQVEGKVPEGTTRVVPEERYEYTGASYYQELEDKSYETTIENLKVGEVAYLEYEVRVNSKIAEGTVLSNQAQIKYAGVTKQTEEIQNVVETGNLRVSVKRITDRSVDLYEAGVVQYFAIIENISNQKQENIKVQTHLPENLAVEILTLYTGMEKEEGNIHIIGEEDETMVAMEDTDPSIIENKVHSEILKYSEEIDIGSLEPGENKVLSYDMLINKMTNDKKEIDFSVTVKNKKEQYESNNWKDKVSDIKVGISMTNNTTSQYVKAGDIIEYTIAVENKSSSDTNGLVVKDSIPSQLTVEEVIQDGQVLEGLEENEVEVPIRIGGNATSNITIKAVVNYSEAREKAEAITNVAYAEVFGEKVATTAEINHIIQNNNNNNNNNKPNEDNNGNDTNHTEDIAKGDKTITGIAWFDENANGQKEQEEKLLSNIKVRLLNTKTNRFVKEENGQILEATTNENGIYVLDKIGNGKYIAIFDYDNTQYALTKYKVEGVAEAENSNVILGELLIENNKLEVASTDIIEVQENNISNINIGLIKLENFDLKLDKQVSKILIQNTKGTTVREYDNQTMAKVELDAKTINGSTVIIEYKIKVTNNGEVEGYAKKIVDYVPTDLKFSSELNKDWYQVGDSLYTTSLANEKIKPGETKTVTLTLTKAMTENNTGLVANTAEIAEDYNELGIADSNSTPGNRAKGENDFGLAEVAISIRTGAILYTSVGIVIIAVLGITAAILIKNKNKKEVK